MLNAPIIVMARVVSRKKMKEAKAGSAVKIAGRDVLATWKVGFLFTSLIDRCLNICCILQTLVALALVPLVFVLYPILAALVGYLKGWVRVFFRCVLLIVCCWWCVQGALNSWAYFALLQPVAMYGSVRFIGECLPSSLHRC